MLLLLFKWLILLYILYILYLSKPYTFYFMLRVMICLRSSSYLYLSKHFPDCETFYKPKGRDYAMVQWKSWFWLEKELDRRIINSGKFLDLGTGPATQAILLAKRGFNVVGSDLSEAAIKRARNVYASEKNVNFIVDDILNSNIKENQFDYRQ